MITNGLNRPHKMYVLSCKDVRQRGGKQKKQNDETDSGINGGQHKRVKERRGKKKKGNTRQKDGQTDRHPVLFVCPFLRLCLLWRVGKRGKEETVA
jgi:hypothetical protein